ASSAATSRRQTANRLLHSARAQSPGQCYGRYPTARHTAITTNGMLRHNKRQPAVLRSRPPSINPRTRCPSVTIPEEPQEQPSQVSDAPPLDLRLSVQEGGAALAIA